MFLQDCILQANWSQKQTTVSVVSFSMFHMLAKKTLEFQNIKYLVAICFWLFISYIGTVCMLMRRFIHKTLRFGFAFGFVG
jgi:hypothetical protein